MAAGAISELSQGAAAAGAAAAGAAAAGAAGAAATGAAATGAATGAAGAGLAARSIAAFADASAHCLISAALAGGAVLAVAAAGAAGAAAGVPPVSITPCFFITSIRFSLPPEKFVRSADWRAVAPSNSVSLSSAFLFASRNGFWSLSRPIPVNL